MALTFNTEYDILLRHSATGVDLWLISTVGWTDSNESDSPLWNSSPTLLLTPCSCFLNLSFNTRNQFFRWKPAHHNVSLRFDMHQSIKMHHCPISLHRHVNFSEFLYLFDIFAPWISISQLLYLSYFFCLMTRLVCTMGMWNDATLHNEADVW